MVERENVPEDAAQASLEDLDAPAGVAEAIELYEAAVRHYASAALYHEPVARISGSSSTIAW